MFTSHPSPLTPLVCIYVSIDVVKVDFLMANVQYFDVLEASQILGKCFEARASISAVISSRL